MVFGSLELGVASSQGNQGLLHYVSIFNPGSNTAIRSLLRIINPGASTATITITGLDDLAFPHKAPVSVHIAGGQAGHVWSTQLEEMGFGDGKWQLLIESNRPIYVMSLLVMASGHLTNLSDWGRPSPALRGSRPSVPFRHQC